MAELNVPTVDFSALGQLPQLYKQGQADALRQQTLANLGQGGTADATALLKSGDLSLAQLGINMQNHQSEAERQARQDAFQREQAARSQRNADRSYGLQERQFTESQDYTPEELDQRRVKQLTQAGVDLNSPEARSFRLSGSMPESSNKPMPVETISGTKFMVPNRRSRTISKRLPITRSTRARPRSRAGCAKG
jgi:hypothetical protein